MHLVVDHIPLHIGCEKRTGVKSSKRDVIVSFPPISWGTKSPLIGQAAHGRMAGIIVLTAWPIRGIPFPHENGGKLSLTALFLKFFVVNYYLVLCA